MGSVSTNETFWAKHDKYVMSTGVPPCPVVITSAKGTRLYDASGRSILDFTSGQMSSLLGHSHPEIVEVVRQSVGELDHLLSNSKQLLDTIFTLYNTHFSGCRV
jgi:4-aminobutyrate aminotransferase-like enzyme